jgi:hypothetical protein
MKTRHRQFEFNPVTRQSTKIASDIVTFVRITGTQFAIVIDKNGKEKRVKRDTLLDVPNNVLYPNIPIVGTIKADAESWKIGSYFY